MPPVAGPLVSDRQIWLGRQYLVGQLLLADLGHQSHALLSPGSAVESIQTMRL
jgi:hypothetical protein